MAINVGNLVKSFMSAKKTTGFEGRKALSDFMKSNNAKGLSGTNVAERMNDSTFSSIRLGESQRGAQDFLAVPSGGANGEYYFLPNFKAYNDNHHVERGAYEIFDSNFSPGQVYDFKNVKNVMPAKGSINSDGTLNITERGSIDFGNGESIKRFERDPVKGITATEIPTASPEQQLAEELAANNAKLLEEAGQPVIEPSVRTPESPKSPTPETPVPPEEPVKTTTEPPVKEQPKQEEPSKQSTSEQSVEPPKSPTPETPIPPEEPIKTTTEPVSVGSGQNIVDKYNSTKAAIKEADWWNNVSTGYNPNGKVNLNRNILAQHASLADNGRWGVEGRNAHFMDRVQKQLNATNSAINRDGTLKTLQEKADVYQTKQREIIQSMLNEGPSISDFFFGNKLHHKLVGTGILLGGANVAFGGHKSNAELYSSPY